MKKILGYSLIILMVAGSFSCNGYYRFIISPRPAPGIIIRPPMPGPGHIWIEGDWFWNGQTYLRRDGYWAIPRDGHRWVPGEWRRKSKGWYWRPGHWRR